MYSYDNHHSLDFLEVDLGHVSLLPECYLLRDVGLATLLCAVRGYPAVSSNLFMAFDKSCHRRYIFRVKSIG